jgi:hypothetical protein
MRLRLVPACVCLCATFAYCQEPPKKEEPAQGPAARGVSQREGPSRFSRGQDEARPAGSLFGRGSVSVRPQWEYAVHDKDALAKLGGGDVAAGLNKLGDEGWELVAVDAHEFASRRGRGVEDFYFKRLKNPPRLAGFASPGSRTGVATTGAGGMSASSTSGGSRGGTRVEPPAQATTERTVVLPLRHASAASLAKNLQQLYGRQPFGQAGVPRIASDDRTNALIVAGPEDLVDAVQALVARLDVQAPERDDKK